MFVTVRTQAPLAEGVPVTTMESVIVPAPVTVPVLLRAAPVQVASVNCAPEVKPPPDTVIGYVPATRGTADGLISLISLPVTVKRAAEGI